MFKNIEHLRHQGWRHHPFGHGRHRGRMRDFLAGRKLSSGELQMALLKLLDESPRHGYELIKALEELSDGYYAPSPGMIYPALTYLEEIGYADVELEGTKKRYRLTEAGRQHLLKNEEEASRILKDLADIGSRMADARRAFSGEHEGEDGPWGRSEGLRKAMRELRFAIRDHFPRTPEDVERIAGIIRKAAEEIAR